MKKRCIIVDDEPLAINIIKKHLSQFEGFEVVATCLNAVEAFNILSTNTVDLIFLDINMPQLNGIEFLKSIEKAPAVIITTAYREYAVESFELDVIDYLVKPIALPRFIKALHKVTRYLEAQTQGSTNSNSANSTDGADNAHIFIKVDKKMVKLYYDSILYIESLKDYVRIKTQCEDFITHYNLSAFTELLPPSEFIRIHRSYTIALSKIKALDGNSVEIANKSLPIGRNFIKTVKERIFS